MINCELIKQFYYLNIISAYIRNKITLYKLGLFNASRNDYFIRCSNWKKNDNSNSTRLFLTNYPNTCSCKINKHESKVNLKLEILKRIEASLENKRITLPADLIKLFRRILVSSTLKFNGRCMHDNERSASVGSVIHARKTFHGNFEYPMLCLRVAITCLHLSAFQKERERREKKKENKREVTRKKREKSIRESFLIVSEKRGKVSLQFRGR